MLLWFCNILLRFASSIPKSVFCHLNSPFQLKKWAFWMSKPSVAAAIPTEAVPSQLRPCSQLHLEISHTLNCSLHHFRSDCTFSFSSSLFTLRQMIFFERPNYTNPLHLFSVMVLFYLQFVFMKSNVWLQSDWLSAGSLCASSSFSPRSVCVRLMLPLRPASQSPNYRESAQFSAEQRLI